MGRSIAASDALAGHHAPAGTLLFREQFTSAPTTSQLADCWMIPFEHAQPIRAPAAFKGQRNFAGLWWCATIQRHIGFESWCERDQLMRLDFDPDVVGISSQPFRIILPASLPQHSHVPDYFVRRFDGSAVLIDIRPDSRVKPADQEVFEATARLCASVGWTYQRLGELPSIYRANLRWLAGYRHPRCLREAPAALMRKHLMSSGPSSVSELTIAAGESVIVLPTLFHMLWTQEFVTDLEGRLLQFDAAVQLRDSP
ncbi:TnsA-like heteromeric transposase endonuclease subunit [Specibacter sp. NPDC078692]|uniref:TnsA-like heteromeric transposase endonuclease subunit n=1 Tax=Specibacter sp. NPDC078692 TaxID=3155818 RepID=UPI003440B8FD